MKRDKRYEGVGMAEKQKDIALEWKVCLFSRQGGYTTLILGCPTAVRRKPNEFARVPRGLRE